MNDRSNLGSFLGPCGWAWRLVCLAILGAFAPLTHAATVQYGKCTVKYGPVLQGVTEAQCYDAAVQFAQQTYPTESPVVTISSLGTTSTKWNLHRTLSYYPGYNDDPNFARLDFTVQAECPAGQQPIQSGPYAGRGCEPIPVQCPAAGTSAGSKTYNMTSPPPETLSIDGCGVRLGGVGVCLPSSGFCVGNYVYTGSPAAAAPPAPADVPPLPSPQVRATPAPPPTREPPTGYPYTETQGGGSVELAEALPGGTARTTTTSEPGRQTVVTEQTYTDPQTQVTTTVVNTTTTYTGGTVVTNVYNVSNGTLTTSTSSTATPPTVASSSAVSSNGPGGTSTSCTGNDCPNNPLGGGNGDGDGDGTFSGPGTGDGLYEAKYPDGIVGVWEQHKATWDQSDLFVWMSSLSDGWPSGGSCPSWTISLSGLPGLSGSGDLSVPCWIWPVIKAILIISALLAARRIIFEG